MDPSMIPRSPTPPILIRERQLSISSRSSRSSEVKHKRKVEESSPTEYVAPVGGSPTYTEDYDSIDRKKRKKKDKRHKKEKKTKKKKRKSKHRSRSTSYGRFYIFVINLCGNYFKFMFQKVNLLNRKIVRPRRRLLGLKLRLYRIGNIMMVLRSPLSIR